MSIETAAGRARTPPACLRGATEDRRGGDDERRTPIGGRRNGFALSASAAGNDEGSGNSRPRKAAIGDIADNVVGDDARVEVLMPPGADPHTFETSAADAVLVCEADLVLAIGLGIEAPLAGLIDSARAEGVDVVELAPQLEPIPFALGDLHDDEDGGHADEADHADEAGEADHAGEDHDQDDPPHGAEDPHVWFDPVRMADGVQLLGEELERRLGPGAWQERAADYRSELLAVHEEIEALTGAVPPERRVLVTNHEAIGYFAHRTAIFAENTANDTLAQPFAREVGRDVEVVTLYSDALGAPGTGAETYLDLLRTNAARSPTRSRPPEPHVPWPRAGSLPTVQRPARSTLARGQGRAAPGRGPGSTRRTPRRYATPETGTT